MPKSITCWRNFHSSGVLIEIGGGVSARNVAGVSSEKRYFAIGSCRIKWLLR